MTLKCMRAVQMRAVVASSDSVMLRSDPPVRGALLPGWTVVPFSQQAQHSEVPAGVRG